MTLMSGVLESPKLRGGSAQAPPGSTEAVCHFHFGVVADKQCTCFASRLMWERHPPTPPAFARYVVASEGCRAEAHRVGGLVPLRMSGLRLGSPNSTAGNS